MQAESLEVLEKADVAPAQARAIVRAIEIEIVDASDTLATKRDVLEQKQALSREITELVASLRVEMAELAASLRGELADLRTDTHTEFAALRTEIAGWRGEIKAEIHAAVSNSTRQMYTALFGQMAVLSGSLTSATHVH